MELQRYKSQEKSDTTSARPKVIKYCVPRTPKYCVPRTPPELQNSCLVGEENYLLTCQRYIELNPVRAGMVNHPENYPWSSYRCNGHGENNPLITPHDVYLQLGTQDNERQRNLS